MSVFATEIIDEEWGNYFELTGAGYGVLVAVMVAILLIGCMISNADGKKKISTGVFCHVDCACHGDKHDQADRYAHGRLCDSVQHAVRLPDWLHIRTPHGTDGGNCLRIFAVGGGSLYHQHPPDVHRLHFWFRGIGTLRNIFRKKERDAPGISPGGAGQVFLYLFIRDDLFWKQCCQL